ncbi:uncharacterized protein LOC119681779 [Teleopsis dalmanni]|uniref:uncharacterized protein LOC119681779 n=1 Tax=Teleopsis dalmanni TaxID=139649 RepID=UPI0018CF80A2|nr:uncharacterized protein LOC119681779 [Teleopsis dalmanni]
MKSICVILLFFGIFVFKINCFEQNDRDTAILRKCLSRASGNVAKEELLKVARYKNWTDEEIPCFTRCIAHERNWFNIEENKWNKAQLVEELGGDMYNYCRFELDRRYDDACEFAYKGLKCLKLAEVQTRETYTTLLNCATNLNASMEQLQRYGYFPAVEEIPCLFKCLADKMNFYTPAYEWNFENWIKAFGPVKYEQQEAFVCKALKEKIDKTDTCSWMYEEYLCIENLNYNIDPASRTESPLKNLDIAAINNNNLDNTVNNETDDSSKK